MSISFTLISSWDLIAFQVLKPKNIILEFFIFITTTYMHSFIAYIDWKICKYPYTADLLAQAEHDVEARPILVCTEESIAHEVYIN